MLFKGFTMTLAAIAVSFASFSATPAKADNDTAKIIAGVAALAIIGAAIADNRNDRRYVTRYHNNYYNPYYRHQRKVYRKHYYHGHGHGHYHGKHHHKHSQHKRW
ncbi:MAG: hypothetical protein AAFY35_03195 [Pseudomonadota bacterium]